MKELDVMITSASRPEVFKICMTSLWDRLKFDGKINYHLHEDILIPEKSAELMKWAESTKKFTTIAYDNPPLGQPLSVHWSIKNSISPIFFRFEDDFLVEKVLDFNLIVKLMEENEDVNQIVLNKRTTDYKHGWDTREVERSGQKLVVAHHWFIMPSVWKKSYIDKYWSEPPKGGNVAWFINPILKGNQRRGSVWMEKNVGAFFMGKFGATRYINHLSKAGESSRDLFKQGRTDGKYI